MPRVSFATPLDDLVLQLAARIQLGDPALRDEWRVYSGVVFTSDTVHAFKRTAGVAHWVPEHAAHLSALPRDHLHATRPAMCGQVRMAINCPSAYDIEGMSVCLVCAEQWQRLGGR